MSVSGVSAALVVGVTIGMFGWLAAPGRNDFPVWLTLAVGVAAALLGTVASTVVTAGAPRLGWVEVLVQVCLAAAGVGLVAATAGRPQPRRQPPRRTTNR